MIIFVLSLVDTHNSSCYSMYNHPQFGDDIYSFSADFTIQAPENWWGIDGTPGVSEYVTVTDSLATDPIPNNPACQRQEPRIVADEAVEFHTYAEQFGLPMPFDMLPVKTEDLDWIQGYGANTFSWTNRESRTYKETHGYHTGIDYGGLQFDTGLNIPVLSLCDGVIVDGRVQGGNGGSTKINTGRGFVLRCFIDSPAHMDPDGDDHRNLSNIVIAYNHVKSLNGNFPMVGQIVYKGQEIAETTHYYSCPSDQNCDISTFGIECTLGGALCPPAYQQANHLHLEIFLARGFRDGQRNNLGGDGRDSIRINPALMFDALAHNLHSSYMGDYYPFRTGYECRICVGVLESPPTDFNDDTIEGNESKSDIDFGILEDQVGFSIPTGDITLVEGERGLFWTRQREGVEGVQDLFVIGPEWTTSTLSDAPSFIQHLFLDETYNAEQTLYFDAPQPHCTNVNMQTGQNLPTTELCNLANDDSDIDIGFIGTR